jgi:sugar O-acyltransferase (sialic acid O-acetyltransferase NeuD family)
MKKDLILIGGGGHCKSCIDVIEAGNIYQIQGILDLSQNVGQDVLGYPIIGTDEDIAKLTRPNLFFFISLGQIRDASKRANIFKTLTTHKVNIPSIVSPLAYVSKHSTIGRGTIIMHFAVINAAAQIGSNCIINTKVLIEHDALIGDHCHISTGATVNGGVKVGSSSFIGSSVVVREYIDVPENSFIKAMTLLKS